MISFYKKAIFFFFFLALFAQINASEQQDQNSETAPVTVPADSNNNDENAPATESVAEPKKAEKNTNVVSEKEKENSKSEADQSQQQTQHAPNNETAQQQESPSGSDNAQNQTATDSVQKKAAQTTTNESSAPQEIVAIETPDEQPVSVTIDVDAPSYDHLVPVPEWNRYSGDSAGSLKEWVRWWKYLRMKTPIVMKWIDDFVVRIYPDNEIFRAIFVKGIYDPNSMVVISSLLPKDGVFIDVGASFGIPLAVALGCGETAMILPFVVPMIAERYGINTGIEQGFIVAFGDTATFGNVLAIGDDEIGVVFLCQFRQKGDNGF